MNTQGSMFTDVGFSSACKKGTIVSFDESLGIYIPAAAKWSKNYRLDGSVIPETSSYVLGVIVSDVVDTKATVLTSGWSKDEELIHLLTGGLSGEYYLDTDGKAKAGRSNVTTLPVYCFCYRKSADAGDVGVLVFNPQPPEYAGHSHGRYALQNTWEVTSTGAIMNLSSNIAVFDALTKGNPDCFSLVKNGSELSSDMWKLSVQSNEATIELNFSPLDTDEFVLHTITPFTAEEPIVRSVDIPKSCKVLKADRDSGNVKLSLNEDAITSGRYTGHGVVTFKNSEICTGPIVQQIHAGPGIALSTYEDIDGVEVPGSFVVSVEELDKQEHDLMLCNLDGAVLGSSANANSYVFPKGLTSKIHGSIRAPYIPKALSMVTGEYTDRLVQGRINILVKGTTASSGSLSLTVNKIRKPQDDEGVISSNSSAYPLNGLLGNDESRVYLLTADIMVNSCDFLSCTIQANKPTAAIELISVSLSLA